MSELRQRLIEWFAEPNTIPAYHDPEDWADTFLDDILDPEPHKVEVFGGTQIMYRLRERGERG